MIIRRMIYQIVRNLNNYLSFHNLTTLVGSDSDANLKFSTS